MESKSSNSCLFFWFSGIFGFFFNTNVDKDVATDYRAGTRRPTNLMTHVGPPCCYILRIACSEHGPRKSSNDLAYINCLPGQHRGANSLRIVTFKRLFNPRSPSSKLIQLGVRFTRFWSFSSICHELTADRPLNFWKGTGQTPWRLSWCESSAETWHLVEIL